MGLSHSASIGHKTDLGAQIGAYVTGTEIYQNQLPGITSKLNSGKYTTDKKQDHVLWIVLNNGTKYYKPLDNATNIWMSCKGTVIHNLSSKFGLSMSDAREITALAVPMLIDDSVENASTSLKAVYPNFTQINQFLYELKRELSGLTFKGQYETTCDTYNLRYTTGSYQEALQHYNHTISGGYQSTSTIVGAGCGCKQGSFYGGDGDSSDLIVDYANSAGSKTKESLISDILAVATQLGLKLSGNNNVEKLKSMVSQLPTANMIKQDAAVHTKTCVGIANAINKVYGGKLIDVKLPPDVICNSILEIIKSLTTGMHVEFLAVYNELRTILKNLLVLKTALSDDFRLINEKINNSDDETIKISTVKLSDMHNNLLQEMDRQITLISNLLNITMVPSDHDIADLIKSKEGYTKYIRAINYAPGTSNFGKIIAEVLSGLGVTANFATIIEGALKTVGVTMEEYAKTDNPKRLRELIMNNMIGKDFKDNELGNFIQAADLLYKNFYKHDEIVKTIKGKGEDKWDYNVASTFEGGVESTIKLDKRIAERRKLRNAIFNTFHKQVNEYFDNMIKSLDVLSMKIGEEIPLSDQLDGFRAALQTIGNDLVRTKGIYFALSGYYNDSHSKSKKDVFVSNLRIIVSYIDSICEMSMYKTSVPYFTDIKTHINSIILLIDKFSEEIAAKFGRGEDAEDYPAPAEYTGSSECPCGDDGYTGGADSELFAQTPRYVIKATKSIADALTQFDYKYKFAQIKSNLKKTKTELPYYQKDYEKMVATSIASYLDDIAKKYEKIKTALETDKYDRHGTEAETTGFDGPLAYDKQKKHAKYFLDKQLEVRRNFWRTIEAMDMYMKHFTNQIINNPTDISDIKTMLDESEIINDWYNDRTGDILTSVFDYFPSLIATADNGGANFNRQTRAPGNLFGVNTNLSVVYPPEKYSQNVGTHYYKLISDEVGVKAGLAVVDSLPGFPLHPTPPSYGSNSREQLTKMFSNLAIIKNLLSLFVYIGGKLGGEEIRKKIFMTPSQMYNNIIEYLQVSTYGIGWVFPSFDGPDFTFDGEHLKQVGIGVLYDIDTCDPIKFTGARNAGAPSQWGIPVAEVIPRPPDGTALALGNEPNYTTYYDIRSQIPKQVIAGVIPVPHNTNIPTDTAYAQVVRFIKTWGIHMRSIYGKGNLDGNMEHLPFDMEDRHFVLLMKAMAAKIFTVTGMFDLFDRPLETHSMSPVRMIVGGYTNEVPKIEDKAVALYIRLPLLAQFYKRIFGFYDSEDKFKQYNDIKKKNALKITMVPDIDGVFSGLIRLIFRKTSSLSLSTFGEAEMTELINEINLIYGRMSQKYNENLVMDTINDLVNEINRRYCVVTYDTRNKYEKEYGYQYEYQNSYEQNEELSNYSILPGEDGELPEKPAPSQLVYGKQSVTRSTEDNKYKLTGEYDRLVHDFRCVIENEIANQTSTPAFSKTIKNVQNKLKVEKDPKERFRLVKEMLSSDAQYDVDENKMLLFHETVVAGLNTLSAIHTMIKRFTLVINSLDLDALDHYVYKYFDSITPVPGVATYNADNLSVFVAKEVWKNLAYEYDDAAVNGYDILHFMNIFGKHQTKPHNNGLSAHNAPNYSLFGNIYDGLPASNVERFISTARVGTIITTARALPEHKEYSIGAKVFGVDGADSPTFNLNSSVALDTLQTTTKTLYGLLKGLLLSDVKEVLNDGTDPSKLGHPQSKGRIDTFFRYIYDYRYVMKCLVESLYGFGQDLQGLIDIKIENDKISIAAGGLKDAITGMFDHIKYFMDILRPNIPQQIMDKYTDKRQVGSFYWLYEQIMEKQIVGRPVIPNRENLNGYQSIDSLNLIVNKILKRLTKKFEYAGADQLGANGIVPEFSVSSSNIVRSTVDVNDRYTYGDVFSELISYSRTERHNNLALHESRVSDKVEDRVGNNSYYKGILVADPNSPHDMLIASGILNNKTLDTRYVGRFAQLYSWDKNLNFNRSSLMLFNQMIAKYIYTFYDVNVQKIYSGLLTDFANGPFNKNIIDQTKTYPDTYPGWFCEYGSTSKIPSSDISVLLQNLPSDSSNIISCINDTLMALANISNDGRDLNDTSNINKLFSLLGPLITETFENTYFTVATGEALGFERFLSELVANGVAQINEFIHPNHDASNVIAGPLAAIANIPGSIKFNRFYVYILLGVVAKSIHLVIHHLHRAGTLSETQIGPAADIARSSTTVTNIDYSAGIIAADNTATFKLLHLILPTVGYSITNAPIGIWDSDDYNTAVNNIVAGMDNGATNPQVTAMAAVFADLAALNGNALLPQLGGGINITALANAELAHVGDGSALSRTAVKRAVTACIPRIKRNVTAATVREVFKPEWFVEVNRETIWEINYDSDMGNAYRWSFGNIVRQIIKRGTKYANGAIPSEDIQNVTFESVFRNLCGDTISPNVNQINRMFAALATSFDFLFSIHIKHEFNAPPARVPVEHRTTLINEYMGCVVRNFGDLGGGDTDQAPERPFAASTTGLGALTPYYYTILKINTTAAPAADTVVHSYINPPNAFHRVNPNPTQRHIASLVKYIGYFARTGDGREFNDAIPNPILFGEILTKLYAEFPFNVELINNRSDLQSRTRLLSHFLVSGCINNVGNIFKRELITKDNLIELQQKTTADTLNMLSTQIRKKNTYEEAKFKPPKQLVKYEEYLTADRDNFDKSTPIDFKSMSMLMAATSDGLDIVKLVDNNITHFAGCGNLIGNYPRNEVGLFKQRGDPTRDGILYTTLSLIIKNLVSTRISQGQSLAYLFDNITDVPIYMREKMRANLPTFRNIFRSISNKCQFLNKFLNIPNLRLVQHSIANVTTYVWPEKNLTKVEATHRTTEQTKKLLFDILDNVSQGCNSLASGCETSLKDVGDEPSYFETYQNFVEDYRKQNNSTPFTPLSSSMIYLENITYDNSNRYLPFHALGENEFKFHYGTRGLFGKIENKPNLEQYPEFKNIVDNYNATVDGKLATDKNRVNDYLSTFVKLNRYLFETKHIKSNITPLVTVKLDENNAKITHTLIGDHSLRNMFNDGLYTRRDIVYDGMRQFSTTPRAVNPGKYNTDNTVTGDLIKNTIKNKLELSIIAKHSESDLVNSIWGLNTEFNETIRNMETPQRQDKIRSLIKYLTHKDLKDKKLDILNILDLNIVPINVHALMREVPLVNIYNYAYTYDRLIVDLYYGSKGKKAAQLLNDLCVEGKSQINSNLDALVQLLIHPHRKINLQEYGFVRNMLAGHADSGELGRPKFLSDQIYNKALFGELYPDDNIRETGPAPVGDMYFSLLKLMIDSVMKLSAGSRNIKLNADDAKILYYLYEQNFDIKFQKIWDLIIEPYAADKVAGGFGNATDLNTVARLAKYVPDGKMGASLNRLAGCVASGTPWYLSGIEIISHDLAWDHGNTTRVARAALGSLAAFASQVLALYALNIYRLAACIIEPIRLMKQQKIGVTGQHISELLLGIMVNLRKCTPAHSTNLPWKSNRNLLMVLLTGVGYPGSVDAARTYMFDNRLPAFSALDEVLCDDISPATAGADSTPESNTFLNSYKYKSVNVVRMTPKMKKIIVETLHRVLINALPFHSGLAGLGDVGGAAIAPNPTIAAHADNDVIRTNSVNLTDIEKQVPSAVTMTQYDTTYRLSYIKPVSDSTYEQQEDTFGSGSVEEIQLNDPTFAKMLRVLGKVRFDTKLIRNLIFVTNLYRSVRLKLHKDLVYSKDIILKSAPITRMSITEFLANQAYIPRNNSKYPYRNPV